MTNMSNHLSRRDYLKQIAAASAAAWMAGEPRLISAAEAGKKIEHPKPTADTCILLWMAGGMAAPETFDPKRYTPFEVGVPVEKILSTFPAIDTAVDNIKISAGAGEHRQGDGPGDADPLARPGRPGQHPALAAPVSLAHRLRPAADGGLPAHRRVDGPRPRAAKPGHPAVHQHRPAARRHRRERRSSRRSPPPASSAASSARSTCRIPTTPPTPCARRRG